MNEISLFIEKGYIYLAFKVSKFFMVVNSRNVDTEPISVTFTIAGCCVTEKN